MNFFKNIHLQNYSSQYLKLVPSHLFQHYSLPQTFFSVAKQDIKAYLVRMFQFFKRIILKTGGVEWSE